MQLMRLGPYGHERPAVRADDGLVYDLSSVTRDIDGDFFAGCGIDRARDALAAGRLPKLDHVGLRVGAPVARPAAIVCVGQNYAAHAAECGVEPPTSPVIFLKHPNTLVGPYDDVLIPRGSSGIDYEVELAVVISQRAQYLDSPDDAMKYIAGYAVSNDVTERTFQFDLSGGQWSKGKCAPTFNPMGPGLVPADEVPSVQSLRLRSRVNGEPRQDSTTADMVFSVAFLVWHLSQFLTLEPGDIINTGTPEGVALSGRFPYLAEGDVVECEIEGLGCQRQVVKKA
ncbi:membrane protein [Carbonactinospora thermoautotrophica]|uniref:2-hydroxyhepta-2 n=1 Tax=Carbonactinospora thermoautotrophica TaxID=1469144 RepID=A0A132MSW5_9ACTN|nr:fumarylacetoacetate hydrolase family protein [Carbonactinospora thermoautotrophica]KWW97677.1 membrane protein [Carbonactinospora thermoautotrophica]KWX00909.1 2-hydroxyhepta-2 [Carbonactinospora thermoautotrophica]KWX03944.1 membrane protein [Carbonactinospora thermoautotrophica]